MSQEELLSFVGMSIGHEISHCFDIEGAQHDETGAAKNWWTDRDWAAFERRSEKLTQYYDSLHPWKDGTAYSGELVQNEAVADLGAMACILRMAAKVPDFDYEAFFRAFAKCACTKFRETYIESTCRTNEHPMEHLRVNVVAAHFPEFQETFGIQPGDGMYVAPEDRIAIWGMPDNTAE